VRAPPTVRFPKKADKSNLPVAPPAAPTQQIVATVAKNPKSDMKLKAGEWAELLNTRLYQWLSEEGKTVAEHSPNLPLAYFDEFGNVYTPHCLIYCPLFRASLGVSFLTHIILNKKDTFDRKDSPEFIGALESLAKEGTSDKCSDVQIDSMCMFYIDHDIY
jgi:hypothetical protein